MRLPLSTLFRLIVVLALAGGLGWIAVAGWQLRQARRAGRALAALLTVDPAHSTAGDDRLSLLQAAAPSLHDGDFQGACDLLRPRDLTTAEQEAARRFLSSHSELRKRFVAAAAEAQRGDRDEAARCRKALAGALCAACDGNASCVEACLASAEGALDASILGSRNSGGGSSPQAVAIRAQAIAPALGLGRELMTETYGPAARLVARASWHYQQRQYDQAAVLLDLARELLGSLPMTAVSATEVPPWFTSMAEALPEDVTPERSRAIVSFCESVAQSQTLSPALTVIVRQAQRERDAGRLAAARWWASVAIEAMGITDEAAAVASAVAGPKP
jgi:hypothetical protein